MTHSTRYRRTTGSVTSAGDVLASCPACGAAAAFTVPPAMVPSADQILVIQRRCDSNWCRLHQPWRVERAPEEPRRTVAQELPPPAAAAPPAPRHPQRPGADAVRWRLGQWPQHLAGLRPSQAALVLAVAQANPTTVAAAYRRHYGGLEPVHRQQMCTYALEELLAIAGAMEVA